MKYFVITLTFVAMAFPTLARAEEKKAAEAAPTSGSAVETGEPAKALTPAETAPSSEDDVSFAGPAMNAQESAVESIDFSPDFNLGVFTIGLWQRDSDTISSKFLEYRDIPNGALAPFFRFQGKNGAYRYDFIGHDVSQSDQRYFGRFGSDRWRFNLDYTGVPHAFGNGGRSILIPVEETDKTDWRISDTLQESFQSSVEALPSRSYETVLPIVQPTLDTQPTNIDIELQRNRTKLAFSLLPADGRVNVDITYFHERRTGNRTNNGTSFGFNNVVETADPIRYTSQDFGIRASAKNGWGNLFAGVNFNDFSNTYDTFGWDNPFRGSDSTSGIAYLGPYTTTEGPKTGLMSLVPSNQAWTVNGGTNLFFGRRTRLTADLQYGQWRQNEQSFIPFTTNTAIVTPLGEDATDPSILPARSLDGKIDVVALNGFFTSKMTDDLRFNARYRFYQNDNQTPRIRFEEGYVRFDAVWEEIPRISVPYGWDSNYLDLYGTYDVGNAVAFEVGYKYNRIAREFRETEHTSENTIRGAIDVRPGGGVFVRGLYELGTRDFDHYDAVEGEEHSFLDPGAPANLTVLRRYDQAKRDRDRVGVQLQFTPDSGIFSLGASYYLNKETYDDSPVECQAATPSDLVFCPGGTQTPLGLQEAEYKTFSLDVDVSPSDAVTVYGFYTREDAFDFQTGRQSGGTISFDPAFNWSSTVDNKVNSIGAGASVVLVPEIWFVDFFYRFQKADGNNAFEAGSALRPPTDIAFYDDTEINFVSAQVRRNFAERWTIGAGGFWEKYILRDTQTGAVLNYMPGSFFVNANNGDYQAWVGWLNLTYRFTL